MTRRIDLGGTWDFVADLDPKYHLDTSIYPSPEYARPTANRRHWLRVRVPGVWQRYAERYDLFEGVCWFAREFQVPEVDAASPARIRFGAVNYLCRIFVNGEEAGSHEGGYTEFTVDVTRRLRSGTNHVAVMVDNRATNIAWPPCLGYFNYGGIHRQVALEILDSPSLDLLDLTPSWEDGRGVLVVRATIAGGRSAEPAAGRGALALEVTCGAARAEGVVDGSGETAVRLEAPDAAPWSPESPALHQVRVRLVQGGVERDSADRDVGFKSVVVREGGVFLNGARTRLKGVCYVYDSPTHGLVMEPAEVDADVALMKEMGCTAVRCHYPMAESFYAACDRRGLLVWIEPPVYCYHPPSASSPSGFALPRWRQLAESTVREMIRSARAHPCVTIYGIGNECNTAHPEAEAFFRGLAELVRREDPTRLVSYAALYGMVGPVAGLVDVLGVNSYWGWYDKVFGGKGLAPETTGSRGTVEREPIDLGEMRTMIGAVLAAAPRRLALLLTEFGADSVPGARSASRDLWSEDYHAELLTAVFALAEEYPQIVGTFPFCFSDYRDPSKVQNGYWDELNLKGIVDYGRRKKLAFGAVSAAYTRCAP
jgi:beta-glucuronidase